MMGLHETIVAELQANKKLWVQIALLADVPHHTLVKVACGYVKDPRIKTIEKIAHGLLELRRIQKIRNETATAGGVEAGQQDAAPETAA